MRRRSVRLTAREVAAVILCVLGGIGAAAAEEPSNDLRATGSSGDANGDLRGTEGVAYGPHGGVVGLVPGSYVCVVYDARRRSCLVRAITEVEIEHAIMAEEHPNGLPGWMRASVDVAVSAAAVGLPVDNAYQLPGLMTEDLTTSQVAMVRCLANSQLGRALPGWDDVTVYRQGIVERCAAENAFHGGVPSLPDPVLPLAARHIQEAVAIVIAAQQLAAANQTYARYAGRFAVNAGELISSAVLPAMPYGTPLMTTRGYVVDRDNRIVVDLQSSAVDVCRALNLMHGRPWAALPEALPAGYRAGCYPLGKGYRFEYRP